MNTTNQTKPASELTRGDVIALDDVPCLVLGVHTFGGNRTRVAFRPSTHAEGSAVRWMAPETLVAIA